MHVENIENALILVGKNNTGKTAVLDAIRLVSGDYQVKEEDFLENYPEYRSLCIIGNRSGGSAPSAQFRNDKPVSQI